MQFLYLCKTLPELREIDIRSNPFYDAAEEGVVGDGDIATFGQATHHWREQLKMKKQTKHFFEIIAIAGGVEGLSLFNGHVILPTTKAEVKKHASRALVSEIIDQTTDTFHEVIPIYSLYCVN